MLLRVQSGRLRVADACALIGLRRRQVFRLLRGLRQDGATSLLSKHRGKRSNHRLPAEVRSLAVSNCARAVCRFGPTLAAAKPAAALDPSPSPKHLAVMPCGACRVRRQGGVMSTLRAGCHFYLAPTSQRRGLGVMASRTN